MADTQTHSARHEKLEKQTYVLLEMEVDGNTISFLLSIKMASAEESQPPPSASHTEEIRPLSS
jgi:hypothetical protein